MMKASVFVILFVFYSSDCRKILKPLDKNANIDFINMEMGGGRQQPNPQTVAQPPSKTPIGPAQPSSQAGQVPASVNSQKPAPTPPQPTTYSPAKPNYPQSPQTVSSTPKPQVPNQIKPIPVNPQPSVNPITTPGYGTVQQLVNFYDSQGKASPIRPYTYSQAVKQG